MGYTGLFSHIEDNYAWGWLGNFPAKQGYSVAIDVAFIDVATDIELVSAVRWLRGLAERDITEMHVKRTNQEGPRGGKSRNIPHDDRMAVYARDGAVCRYCRKFLRITDFHVDHIIPVSQAGESNLNNYALSCPTCNISKGGRTPEEAGMELLPI